MEANIAPVLQTERWRPRGDNTQLGIAEEWQNHSSYQGHLMPKPGACRPRKDAPRLPQPHAALSQNP